MVIRDEYLNGSQTVVKKLDWLQENGWDQVWRARGDGDCFYRCKRPTGRAERRSKLNSSIHDSLYTEDPTIARSIVFVQEGFGVYQEG